MTISDVDDYSVYLYHQGTNHRSYLLFGAHLVEQEGVEGVRFTLWAPHATSVSVVGNFNGWQVGSHVMEKVGVGEGIWILFVPELAEGELYKYAIADKAGRVLLKADPYAFQAEVRPNTASRIYRWDVFEWHDEAWRNFQNNNSPYESPQLTYEVHLGSWRRGEGGRFLSYQENADQLVKYAKQMHYTHIELMPLNEYPYDGSWGYQVTGYFAITSRYGNPEDFMYFINRCHQEGLAVILDWVPGHFCRDEYGLRQFDGEPLYESGNAILAENTEWGTTNFDYGRPEVQSFLISSAMFLFDVFHIDGLRIDAVANMLYLNYGRTDGKWQPNKYGGSGNLEAMDFLRNLNKSIFKDYPNALMTAEESTSWPMISQPVYMGGMGFNFKWNMGWMNDILKYMEAHMEHRRWKHNLITFSLLYAFSENFILPLSHDEMVHGKKSLIEKMPGDYWQKFANLRVLYAYWIAHPGKKLLFMGAEFGQFIEWNYNDSLDWHLLDYPMHKAMQRYSRHLNGYYRSHRELWQIDCDWTGFEWIDCNDAQNSIISFIRYGKLENDMTIIVCNFTPDVHYGYRIGVPANGVYTEVFNSDSKKFGGSGVVNKMDITAELVPWHGREFSFQLTVPPLAAAYFRLR